MSLTINPQAHTLPMETLRSLAVAALAVTGTEKKGRSEKAYERVEYGATMLCRLVPLDEWMRPYVRKAEPTFVRLVNALVG